MSSKVSAQKLSEREVYTNNELKSKVGLDIQKLKIWKTDRDKEFLNEDNGKIKQELEMSRMRKFAKAVAAVIKLQAWVRCMIQRRKFRALHAAKIFKEAEFFHKWLIYWKSEKKLRITRTGRCFRAWAMDCKEMLQMTALAIKFFNKAFSRPYLTNQTVRAFFEPHPWHGSVTEKQRTKIRFMLLDVLFTGWLKEFQRLKINRFKASQAIIRANRAGQGRMMWAQEMKIVTFHLWHRFTATRSAFAKDLPAPHFPAPVLSEWRPVLQALTSKQVRKKRAAHKARLLLFTRAFRSWRHLQGCDLPPDVFNNEAMATRHYKRTLLSAVLLGWHGCTRERGAILRRTERCFKAWARWAPRKRRLVNCREQVLARNLFLRKARAYRLWSSSCHDVIGKRIHTLRGLRKNLCARPVLCCLYAWAGCDAQLAFLMCWRRWQLWWSRRRRWKIAQRQCRITWHICKAKEIFSAWAAVARSARRGDSTVDTKDDLCATDVAGNTPDFVRRSSLYSAVDRVSVPEDPDAKPYVKSGLRAFVDLLGCGGAASIGEAGGLKLHPDAAGFFLCCQAAHFFDTDHDRRNQLPDPEPATLAERQAAEKRTEVRKRETECRQRLQKACDAMDTKAAAAAIREGAEVQSRQIEQISGHFGDDYLVLLGLLLSCAPAYCARRVLKDDANVQIMAALSPLGATMLGAHLGRWKRRDLTNRELAALGRDEVLASATGSRYQSTVMWRAVALRLLHHRCTEFRPQCRDLAPNATENDEVALVLRRRHYFRLKDAGRWCAQLLQIQPMQRSASGSFDVLDLDSEPFDPPLEADGKGVGVTNRKPNPLKDLPMGPMLREYLLLTGKLQDEARSLRRSLLQRDLLLLSHGFEKQARLDYLDLRRSCISPRTLAAEEAEKEKLEKSRTAKPPKKKATFEPQKKATFGKLDDGAGSAVLSRASSTMSPKSQASSVESKKNSLSHTSSVVSGKSSATSKSGSSAQSGSSSSEGGETRTMGESHTEAESRTAGDGESRTMGDAESRTMGDNESIFAESHAGESHLGGESFMGDAESHRNSVGGRESSMGSSMRGARERSISPQQSKSRLLTHKLSLVLARQHAANSTASAIAGFGGLDSASYRPVSSEFSSDRIERRDVLVESWSPSLFASPHKTSKFLQISDRKCLSTQQMLIPRLLELTKSFGLKPPAVQTQQQTTGSVAVSRWFLSSCFDVTSSEGHVPFPSVQTSYKVSQYVPPQWFDPARLLSLLEADLRLTEKTLTEVEEKAQATHVELEQMEQRKVGLLDYIKKTRAQLVKAGKKAYSESKDSKVIEKTKERLMMECVKQANEKQFQIRHLQSCIATCQEKFKNANYAEIFNILDSDALTQASRGQVAAPTVETAAPPSTPQQSAPLDNDKMRSAALDLIRSRELALAPMTEDLTELEAKARRHELDHRVFIQQKQATSQVMRGLAQDRFSTIVDVQELVQRHTDQLAKLEAQGDEQVDSLARLTCYRDELLALLPMLQSQKRQSCHSSGRQSGFSLSGASKGGIFSDGGDGFPRSERIAARDFLNQDTDFDIFDEAVRLRMDAKANDDQFDVSVAPLTAPSGLELSQLQAPSPPKFRGELESGSGSVASSCAEESWDDGSSKEDRNNDLVGTDGRPVPKVVTATHPLIEEQSTISTVTYSQKSGADDSFVDPEEPDEETQRNNLEELRIQVFDEYWQTMEAAAPKHKKKSGTARIAAAKNRALALEKEALAISAAEIKPSSTSRKAKMWLSVSASTRRSDYVRKGDVDDGQLAENVAVVSSSEAEGGVEEGLQLDVANVDAVWKLDAAGEGDSHYGLKVNPSVSMHGGAHASPGAGTHASEKMHTSFTEGMHSELKHEPLAEDGLAAQNLGVSAVRKGVRISTKVLGRHDVQPTITRVDPFSAVGVKEADRLKMDMARSRQRIREEAAEEAAEREQAAADALARLKRLGRVWDETSEDAGIVKSRPRVGARTRSKVRFGDEEGEALTSTGVSATSLGSKRLEASLGKDFDYAKIYSAIDSSNSFEETEEDDEGHCACNFYPFVDYEQVPRITLHTPDRTEHRRRHVVVDAPVAKPAIKRTDMIAEGENEDEADDGSEFAQGSLPSFGGVVAVKVTTQSTSLSVSSRLSGSRQDTIREGSDELDSFDDDSSSIRSEIKRESEQPVGRKGGAETSLQVEGVNKDYRKKQKHIREKEALLAATRPAEEAERKLMAQEDTLSDVHRPSLNYCMKKAQTFEELRDLLLHQSSFTFARTRDETPLPTPPLTPSSNADNESLPIYSDYPLPLSVLAAVWNGKSAHKPKKVKPETPKGKAILIKKSAPALSKSATDEWQRGIAKKTSRAGDLRSATPTESPPMSTDRKFPVDITIRLAEKSLASFDRNDELWLCEDLAKSLKLPSARAVQIRSLSAGSVVVHVTAYFDSKESAKAASDTITRALESISARFGKASLSEVSVLPSQEDEEQDDEPLYADLSALIEGELDEAHLKKAALEGTDQSDWDKSELSTQLLGRCLAGLEKKLQKPGRLVRGKEPTKAALAKILRETRSRGGLSSALSIVPEASGGGTLDPNGLLGAGLANASTAWRPAMREETDRRPISSVLPTTGDRVIRNPWDSSGEDLKLPLVGASLKTQESPLLQSNLAALRLRQERLRTRQSQSQSLNQVCGTLLEDADEDLMIGYAAVLRASAPPETQLMKHFVLPTVKNDSKVIFDDEDPKPLSELVVTGAGPLPSSRSVAATPKAPINSVKAVPEPAVLGTESTKAVAAPACDPPQSARSHPSLTASEEALELSSVPTAPPAPLMPSLSSSSVLGMSLEEEADIERELRAELRRMREKRSAAVAKSTPVLPTLKPSAPSSNMHAKTNDRAQAKHSGLEIVGGGKGVRGKAVNRPNKR